MRSSRKWLRRSAAAAGAGSAGGALALLAGGRRWRAATERLVHRLEAGTTSPEEHVAFERLRDLPPPVERYFRLVLRDGQPRVRAAVVHQRGTFRSREGGDTSLGWAPFSAVEHFAAEPPGFVWDARIRMAPLVTVRVRDGYVAGSASMRGAMAALVSVVNAGDTPELRAGALQRWLAEAVWLPTALLPRPGLRWSAVDDTHARATVTDGTTAVSLVFEFDRTGEIVAAGTPARLRAVPGAPGEYLPAPWGARYTTYEEQGGMWVPAEAEVYWMLGGREEPYYRGRNDRITYQLTAGATG